MKQLVLTFSIFVGILFLSSCEKVVDVEVPDGTVSLVIEGSIENGQPAYVIVSNSQEYFSPISTSLEALSSVLDTTADVYVSVDGVEHQLQLFCLSQLDSSLQGIAEELLGIGELPPGLDFCAYVDPFNPALIGEVGKSYGLRVVHDGEEYTASTRIPELVALDSLWFKLQPPNEGLGFIWCTLTDPDTIGNAYRLSAQRIGVDGRAIPVPGASFDDRFFSGESFDYNFARGSEFGTVENEDSAFFFATGDVVAIKHATTDLAVYEFWETADDAIAGGGSPFISPTQIKSNISNGARGVWGGYGVVWDTLVCIPVQ